jgi:cell shape-determining protein MreC
MKKNDENIKQQDEIIRLSYEMRDIHRRLNELKKENDELKLLLSITGKHRHDYEIKVIIVCLSRLISRRMLHIFIDSD